jgi:hypothetical protein
MRDTIRYAKVNRISKKLLVEDAYKKSNMFKGWHVTRDLFDWVFNQMVKRGYLQPYYDDVVTEMYDYTPAKCKLLSDKIMKAIHNYEYDFNTTITPDDYVVVMGEDTYFQTVHESDINTPYFYSPMMFKTDLAYNDPYRGRVFNAWSVHVVPGFDGFVILPKAIVEKRVG